MKVIALALVAALALPACGGSSLSDQPQPVAVYYADAQLSADTIEACRARNEAEFRLMLAKPACVNVRLAQEQHSDEAQAVAEAKYNSAMEQLMRDRKAARAARAAAG